MSKLGPKKHQSNKSWIHEHVNDHYVQKAKAGGWRSRAAFKLSEIDAKDKLLKPGMAVVDLGAAPGSWSQYAAQHVRPRGRVIALDLLEMTPLAGVDVIRGDFRDDATVQQLENLLEGHPVDLVLSDMAPNISGIAISDQARAQHLAELAFDFARQHLRPGGDMLIKVFQGSGFDDLRQMAREVFEVVHIRKPDASRDRSPEMFLLGRKKRT